jgi:hypothetical protein
MPYGQRPRRIGDIRLFTELFNNQNAKKFAQRLGTACCRSCGDPSCLEGATPQCAPPGLSIDKGVSSQDATPDKPKRGFLTRFRPDNLELSNLFAQEVGTREGSQEPFRSSASSPNRHDGTLLRKKSRITEAL